MAALACAGGFGFKTVSTHSHPKVAANYWEEIIITLVVSTHSHPKVAAVFNTPIKTRYTCFNTQPPEGGCLKEKSHPRWIAGVSTHSHPKVAAI